MNKSPEGLLNRAADRLEELATEAPSGRWDVQEFPGVPAVILTANYRSILGYHVTEGGRAPHKGAPVMQRAAAMWAATMSPAVAAPLAKWLRDTAKYMRFEGGAVSSLEASGEFFAAKYGGAIKFAKLIVGEE